MGIFAGVDSPVDKCFAPWAGFKEVATINSCLSQFIALVPSQLVVEKVTGDDGPLLELFPDLVHQGLEIR